MFKHNFVPAHDIGHVRRVVIWTEKIVMGEKAKNIFICELSAWLHDIGRTIEDNPGESSRRHHELSYELLRQWFKEDREFDFLTKNEKLELLYAVRYHWNNRAEKYESAWILRDADKLDSFGKVGMDRIKEIFENNEVNYNRALREVFDNAYNVKTKTAKKLMKKNDLMNPVEKVYSSYLRSKIEKIEL